MYLRTKNGKRRCERGRYILAIVARESYTLFTYFASSRSLATILPHPFHSLLTIALSLSFSFVLFSLPVHNDRSVIKPAHCYLSDPESINPPISDGTVRYLSLVLIAKSILSISHITRDNNPLTVQNGDRRA